MSVDQPVCTKKYKSSITGRIKIHKNVPRDNLKVCDYEDIKLTRIDEENHKKPLLEGYWSCDYNIKMLATLNLEQADRLIKLNRGGDSDLPWYCFKDHQLLQVSLKTLEMNYQFMIKPMTISIKWSDQEEIVKSRFSEGYVLWCIASEYESVFHMADTDSLFIENLEVSKEGMVTVGIT